MIFAGFDTSNYTTSVALYDDVTGAVTHKKRLLDVKDGEVGLRQSDAVFMHTIRLAALTEELFNVVSEQPTAVAASTRPRTVEGSYMPCFLVGEGHARSVAAALRVPFYAVSHQQNHIAAALWSAGRLDLLDAPHIAFHVSGGTTELLRVTPGMLPMCAIVGGTNDVAAGQIIDRCGVRLGLDFPAGAELETLAVRAQPAKPFLPKGDVFFSLSGIENKCNEMIDGGEDNTIVARFVLDSLAAILVRSAVGAVKQYGLPLVCAGGVMCNSIIRGVISKSIDDVVFAKPEFSSDNAAGAAILAERLFKRGASV